MKTETVTDRRKRARTVALTCAISHLAMIDDDYLAERREGDYASRRSCLRPRFALIAWFPALSVPGRRTNERPD